MQKRIGYIIFLVLSLSVCNVYAIQPIEDEDLALSAGENSLVLDSELISSKKFIVEQDLSFVELPAYQSLIVLNLRYHTSMIRIIGEQIENFTKYFGLEPLSSQWYGNYNDIVDINRFSNVSFNRQTGSYELNNVQGRVWVEVETISKHN